MKTIEEFIKEVNASEALKNEMKTVMDKDAAAAFLKKYDVNATAEEFVNAINAVSEGELSDDDAESVAGGFTGIDTPYKRPKQIKMQKYRCTNPNCPNYGIDIDYPLGLEKCGRCRQTFMKVGDWYWSEMPFC